jgi:hypothetical protein
MSLWDLLRSVFSSKPDTTVDETETKKKRKTGKKKRKACGGHDYNWDAAAGSSVVSSDCGTGGAFGGGFGGADGGGCAGGGGD